MELFYSETQILNGRNTDKFFVDYSTDDLENNLLILGQLHFFGNHLTKKLDEKLKYRKENLRLNYLKYKEFVGIIKHYSLLAQGLTVENFYYQGDEETFEKDYKTYKDELISNLENNYLTQFSLEKLVESYLENDEEEYLKQSKFFKIDFKQKFSFELLEKRDLLENNTEFNSYNNIYSLFERVILSDDYKNGFYPIPQHGGCSNQENLIIRYFPKEDFNIDSAKKIIQNRLIDFIVELIKIIYFEKNQYPPTFYVRVNLHSHPKEVLEFKNQNQIAILVDQPDELDYWNYVIKDDFLNKNKYVQFIGRWFDLQKTVNDSDVIIIAQYFNSSEKKIGLIRKGTKFFEEGENREFKVFQLTNVNEIEKKDVSIFNSIITQSATLSPIKQRLDFINYKFNNRPSGLGLSLDNISPKLIELLCLEWLRSDLCDRNLKIKYQLLNVGGNYGDVDIFGKTFKGKKIGCQVTYSKDKNLISKKIIKLKNFESDIRIMFCNAEFESEDVIVIPLIKVWNDLTENEEYLEFLKFLSFN